MQFRILKLRQQHQLRLYHLLVPLVLLEQAMVQLLMLRFL
ncbi:hypothetical protein N008_15155 [Hymenobacter sp. APR13]|nr:hypothetical protein N008_15155 [Hymenobacter sp. APR13]